MISGMRVFILCILLVLIGTGVGMAMTPMEARVTLGQMNIKYTEEAFFDSIANSDAIVVGLFLDAGMSADVQPKEGKYKGYLPIILAAEKKNVDVVDRLLAKGANVNAAREDTQDTALITAVTYNNAEVVKLLLKGNADVSAKNSRGKNALDIAIAKGYTDIEEVLKAAGATSSPNVRLNSLMLPKQLADQAVKVGNLAAEEKQDIIFNEMDTDKAYVGMMVKSMGRAYSISPFCAVANEAMQARKKFTTLKQETITKASQEFRVAFVFTLPTASGQFNVQEWADMQFILIQDGKIIRPVAVSEAKPQLTTATAMFITYQQLAVGFVAAFDASDIDAKKPIEIKSVSKASKELTFKFALNYAPDAYNAKVDEYKW